MTACDRPPYVLLALDPGMIVQIASLSCCCCNTGLDHELQTLLVVKLQQVTSLLVISFMIGEGVEKIPLKAASTGHLAVLHSLRSHVSQISSD